MCYQSLKNVGRIRKVLSFENTEILVHVMISSRIDYCNSLYINIGRKHIFKLQKVQNSDACIIKLKNQRHSATSLLNELHWLQIQQNSGSYDRLYICYQECNLYCSFQ